MKGFAVIVLFGLAFVACSTREKNPAGAPATSASASPLRDPTRFDCVADTDCVNVCAYGAVSSAWVRRTERTPGYSQCKDGCAGQLAAPPRCEEGKCAAYMRDPRDDKRVIRAPECTRRER